MNMKALLGTVLALLLAVGGTAYLAARGAKPEVPPPLPPPVGSPIPANPFDLSAPGKQPKVVVAETHFEFGVMGLGGTQSHDFVFKNEGEGPLRVAKGFIQCKCTIPDVTDQAVQPGQSVNIKLTWKPEESSQEFRKEAVIWTNDPTNPKITLSINGIVFDDPGVYPSQFAVGDIPWDKEHESEVTVASPTAGDLKIDGYEASHPEWMSLSWTPVDIAKLIAGGANNPKPLSGYSVKLKILPNASVGPFNGWVKLKLNRKDGIHQIDVTGSRTGPIKIHGEYYQAALSLITLKRLKSAEGKEVKLFVFLDSFGEDLQLKEVLSESKNLTATLQKKSPTGGKKDSYILLIQAKPGITAGTTFSSDHPDGLILKLNHPQVPELVFKASYIVQ